jgi:hypothetical protein
MREAIMPTSLTGWGWVILALTIGVLAIWWRRRLSDPEKSDIKRPTLETDLQWDSAPDDALRKVHAYVLEVAEGTVQWYRAHRGTKRWLGFGLRLSALVLTVAAGLVPLFPIAPVWSTVALAVAGLLISIDVLAGHTSGWVRYMLAQQKVDRAKDTFLLEWNALKVAKADVAGMLELAKTFLLAVGKIVDDETMEWAAEFQSALKEMEKARKAAIEIERGGAIEVTVRNANAVTEWVLEIDGSQRGRTSGRSLAVTEVAVGVRKLRAYGDDPRGKRLSDEKTIKVEGGATVAKELELS